MCTFSHFDRRSRSRTSKYLTLVFVISLFAHGSSQVSTAIWLLVTNLNPCSYLRMYLAPIILHLLSGTCALALSFLSVGLTLWYRCTSYTRYFIFGLSVIIILELCSMISSVVLINMLDTRLSDDMAKSYSETKLVIGHVNSSDTSGDITCWNELQQKYKCCGFNKYTDWCVSDINATNCVAPNEDLISSCSCDHKTKKKDSCSVLNNQPLTKHACYDRVVKKLKSSLELVLIMDIVFCLVQCVTYMIVSCLLLKLNSTCAVETYREKTSERVTSM